MPMRPAWQDLTKLHQKVEQIVESKLILTERRLSRASCVMSGGNTAAERHVRLVDDIVVQVSKLPVSIATSSIMACVATQGACLLYQSRFPPCHE